MPTPQNLQTREVQTHPVYRLAEVGAVKIRQDGDEEVVELELSFSSEYAVERYDYWEGDYHEILDHDPGSVRLDRLNNGAPFLMDHDTRSQAGVIESARIENKRGMATIRLSKNARNLPGYGDVVADLNDGVRRLVSVGYRVYRATLSEEVSDGPDVYRMTDWEPFEISSVPVPADPTVGLDRAAMEQRGEHKPNTLIIEGRTMPDPVEPTVTDTRSVAQMVADEMAKQTPVVTRAEPTASVTNQIAQVTDNLPNAGEIKASERSRLLKIDEAAAMIARMGVDQTKVNELVTEFRNGELDAGEFYVEAMARHGEKLGTPVEASGEIGLSGRELDNYSIFRAVNVMDKLKQGTANQREISKAGLEIEAANAAAALRSEKRQPSGMLIPDDVLNKRSIPIGIVGRGVRMALALTRDLTVGAGTANNLVDTTLDMVSFIEILRANLVLESLGTRVITGLVGDLAIPRQTGGVTTYWVGEGGNITESTPAFDTVTLTPHTLGAAVDISRKTLIQVDSGIAEAITMVDMARAIALEITRAGIHGAPAISATENEPLGVLNLSGIGSVAAAGYTRDLLVNLEGEVSVDNALMGSLGFLTNTTVRKNLKLAKVDTGSGQFVWPTGETELEGYNVEVTNLVSKTLGTGTLSAMIFGNWDDQMLGMWSGLDINLDSSALSLSGGLRMVGLQDVDFAYRRAQSFAAAIDLPAS